MEDQRRADERIPLLLETPAAVRFLSVEPLLGPVQLGNWLADHEWDHGVPGGVNWVIIGGESGPGARPMELDWVRSIRDQCQAAGIPVFIKQLGSVWAKAERDRLDGRRFQLAADDPMPDSKGGDMRFWPQDLRVREWPR